MSDDWIYLTARSNRADDLGESGKLVLSHAQRIAGELGSGSVGSAHLFLGVVGLERPLIRRQFEAQGLDVESIAGEVRREVSGRAGNSGRQAIGVDAEAALKYAGGRAAQGGRRAIWAPHILMAVLADREGPAACKLEEAGADLNKLGKELWAMVELRWTEAPYREARGR